MMRIEDMDAEQIDNYIAYLKTSIRPQQSIELVALMQIRLGMQEQGVDTVQALLDRIPKAH